MRLVLPSLRGWLRPFAFYSTLFWEHTPSVALFLVALCALAIAERHAEPRKWLIICGIAASLATFIRLEQLFVTAGIIGILLLRRWRWAFWVGIPFAVTALIWLGVNYGIMGHIISKQWGPGDTRLNFTTGLFWGVRDAGIWFVPYILFNAPKIIAFALNEWLLTLGTLCVLLCCVLPFWAREPDFARHPVRGLARHLLLGFVSALWLSFDPRVCLDCASRGLCRLAL